MQDIRFGDVLFVLLTFLVIHLIMRWVYYLRDLRKRQAEARAAAESGDSPERPA